MSRANTDPEKVKAQRARYRALHRDELRRKGNERYARDSRQILGRRRDSKYGLAPGQFDRMVARQGGVCAMCRGKFDRHGPVVDHDHETGRVRGLLCFACNRRLGVYELIREIAERYLAWAQR